MDMILIGILGWCVGNLIVYSLGWLAWKLMRKLDGRKVSREKVKNRGYKLTRGRK